MEQTKSFDIIHYPWDFNGYKPKTFAEVTRDDNGFRVHFVSYETELTAVQTEHNTDIYCDSAVEVFLNFVPDKGDTYINFEIKKKFARTLQTSLYVIILLLSYQILSRNPKQLTHP